MRSLGFTEVGQESLSDFLRQITQELNDRRAQSASGTLGWHNTFEPGRVGTTGSALPLRFLQSIGQISDVDQAKILAGLVSAQHLTGGWCILSIPKTPTVEGTAPTLLALVEVGDATSLGAIDDGVKWLQGVQNEDGGWGSASGNESRTCLTGTAVAALARIGPRARSALARAKGYLECAQNLDGGWGAKAGQPSNVLHTALGVRGLIGAGSHCDDQAVQKGLKYINQYWSPDPRSLHHEAYNVLVDTKLGHHSKVSLVHDVDAEVVQTLALAAPIGLNVKTWQAVSGWLSFNADARWWTKLPEDPSLWTIVPRGMAVVQLRHVLGEDWKFARHRAGVAAFSASDERRDLIKLLVRILTIWPAWTRRALSVFLSLTVVALIVLTIAGEIDLQTLVVGGIWPLLLAILIPALTSSNDN